MIPRSELSTTLVMALAALAMGPWLIWPGPARAQSISATVPAGAFPRSVAVNRSTNKIYIANDLPTGTVTIIDGTTRSVTTVSAGWRPFAVTVDELANKIYVANLGSQIAPGGRASVTVIDGVTNATTNVVDPTGSGAFAIAVNSSTHVAYVANIWSATVTAIDGATLSTTTVSNTKAAGVAPVAIAVNPVTNKIYVANRAIGGSNPGSVTIIDGATNSTVTVADPNAVSPDAIAVNMATNKIYVANEGAYPTPNYGNVTEIDGLTNVTKTITDPHALAPQAIAVNETTNTIYVANANNATASYVGVVSVIDGATKSVTTISDPNAQSPAAVAVNEAANTIYVANGGCALTVSPVCGDGSNPGSITLIDGATKTPVTLINAQATTPIAVAVNSTTNEAYAADIGSGNVTVIDGGAAQTTHTLGVVLAGNGSGTVTSNPSGVDCGQSSCAAVFAAGESVHLAAVAASPAVFVGWSGPCNGINGCDLVSNEDQFVTATFTSPAALVAVPDVVGQTESSAEAAILAAGFAVGSLTQQSSSTVGSGNVIGESPAAGAEVASGISIDLVISSGSVSGGSTTPSGGGATSRGAGSADPVTLAALLLMGVGRLSGRVRRPCVDRGGAIGRITATRSKRCRAVVGQCRPPANSVELRGAACERRSAHKTGTTSHPDAASCALRGRFT